MLRALRWLTVGLTLGFAGQAFSYYGVTAWLPSFLSDELAMGTAEAGAGSSLFQIFAIVGGLGVPLLARFASTTTVAVTLSALWLTVPVGLLLAPSLWWLWSSLGGVAQGGGITVIFIAIIKFAQSQAAAGRMSAVVQGWATASLRWRPRLLGYVHSVTDGVDGPAVRDPRLGACVLRVHHVVCALGGPAGVVPRRRPDSIGSLLNVPCARHGVQRGIEVGGLELCTGSGAWVSPAAGLPPRRSGSLVAKSAGSPASGLVVCRYLRS